MQHSIGIPRNQLLLKTLDDSISQGNPVRFIDTFVEHVSFKSIFTATKILYEALKNTKKPPTFYCKKKEDF